MAMKDQKRASDTADERMKLVAPLLDPKLDKNELQKRKMEVCESGNVSLRTLNRHLQAYENGGYSALISQGRSSTGYKIPDDLVEAAIQLRREVPERSIPTIIQILELEGKAPSGFLKSSTLQDALSRKGYSASMMKITQIQDMAPNVFNVHIVTICGKGILSTVL